MRDHSYENVFPLHVYSQANYTDFQMKGRRTLFETETQVDSEMARYSSYEGLLITIRLGDFSGCYELQTRIAVMSNTWLCRI